MSPAGTATLILLGNPSQTPIGTVDFLDTTTNTLLGNEPLQLVNGNYVAYLPVANLTAGLQFIQAIYEGDSYHRGVWSGGVITTQTTTTVTANPVGPLTVGEPVTFTVTVSGQPSVGTVLLHLQWLVVGRHR